MESKSVWNRVERDVIIKDVFKPGSESQVEDRYSRREEKLSQQKE